MDTTNIDNTKLTRDDILDKSMMQPITELYIYLQNAAKDVAEAVQLYTDDKVLEQYLRCAYERYLNAYELISSFALTGLIPLGYFTKMFLHDIQNIFNNESFCEQIREGYFPYLEEVYEKFMLKEKEE